MHSLPYEDLFIKQHPDCLISYKGPITPEVIAKIVAQLENKLPVSETLTNRISAISIELAQNMQHYSLEMINYGDKMERVGWFQILDEQKGLAVNCGNVLGKSEVKQLLEHFDTICQLDKEGLRGLKRQRRRMRLAEENKGAGIGLIQVALLAGNPPLIEVIDINKDLSCIIFKINIKK